MKNDKNKIEVCSCNVIHKESVDKVKSNMIEKEITKELASFFKVLGDPTRIKILYALSLEELCVCDISNILEMNQSAISHQLRILRAARLVKYRKQGKTVFYSLDDQHVQNIFGQGLEHIKGEREV
ncbi:hypothetical protein CLOACE_08330 [Clostridium acetireducens DSM 10703]|uniref:HTH arsR-type domain-containing protein n=1 Tax=Clostridium acetireducens DSM 10703 TaxID=1121290 RepID=A0A1E8EZT3_9CLOT|nr:metalloregulator ArsR/SmtB family transcription factor [Clostridium acetireducens]OFI06678.1 hypothetical protein CLOACE_08330 [Clostridium acetireducens DSM 10703]